MFLITAPKSNAENAMGVLAFKKKKSVQEYQKSLEKCYQNCFLVLTDKDFEQLSLLHDKAKHSFNICRIDDIEDNSNLRRGIPGNTKF